MKLWKDKVEWGWTCDECGENVTLVQLGHEEDEIANICASCLRKALKLVEEEDN